MKFNINAYKGKYAMHCKTKEEAIDFCDYLNSLGKKTIVAGKYSGKVSWNYYGNQLAINFNEGAQSSISYYRDNDYTILEWEDFMNSAFTKEDLKTGDVIKRRNGDVEIVNLELDMLICKSGWTDLSQIRKDLTHTHSDSHDIVAVRRPITKSDCVFCAFNYEWGTLVYERREVEEMTLEQVCKLLGKEIKIIK